VNRSHRGGHDHPDDDALTIGCSACIARVEHDQAEAAWAVAPLRRCTWTFDASLDASMSFALDVRVPAGVEPWEVDERYCDLTGEQISDALAAATPPDGPHELAALESLCRRHLGYTGAEFWHTPYAHTNQLLALYFRTIVVDAPKFDPARDRAAGEFLRQKKRRTAPR